MITARSPVVVVGCGLAGLTAATYLRRHGVSVRVFEASPNIAGLARSQQDDAGFTYDFGAHFITNRLAAATGCSAICRDMPRYGETVWLKGRQYSYPWGLLRNGRYLGSALAVRCRQLGQRPAVETAADWYRAKYGSSLANEVAIPLTEAWSGAAATELAASVGSKFATSLFGTLCLKSAGWWTGRTVAVGYSSTVQESAHVWHVYPHGGIGAVCEKLATELQEVIQTKTPVESILVEQERVVGVRAGGQYFDAAAVVSTAPVHVLAKLVTGTTRLEPLGRFRYRPMAFVNLRFEGPSGLPDVVTWTPGAEVPFFRLSDIGAGLPWLVPAGFSQVTADIGCEVGDAVWNESEEALGLKCVEGLERMVPGISRRYLGCRVLKTPLAYPVYRLDYEADRRAFEKSTGISGLVSVGRNGEFTHSLMEDVYWRTRRKVQSLVGHCSHHAPA